MRPSRYWLFLRDSVPLVEPCQEDFIYAFWLADAFTALTAAGAAAGTFMIRDWAIPCGIITAAGLFFATLNWVGYFAFNRWRYADVEPGPIVMMVACALLAFALTLAAWKSRSFIRHA